jgi:hypothetical protein
MKTAYSYQRWSTAGQGDNGRDSKTRQTDSANRWIQDHGTPLGYVLSNEVFLDAGKSGYKGKHIAIDTEGKAKGDLMRFIQSVESGRIKRDSILLVDDFSRFSRLAPFKSLKLFTDVIDSGIGLVFTGSYEKRIINQDLINKEGNVLQFIIGELIRSHAESFERGRKVSSAYQTKLTNIKDGIIRRSHLPAYFTFVPNEPANSKCNVGKYVHNENTKIIKEIISLYLSGKSLYSISDILNDKGLKTFKGNVWYDNSISKLLKSRTLLGEYKGVKNYAPQVIPESDFNKIQVLLKQNLRNRGQRGNFVNIFRGVCFCSQCGKSMEVANRYKDYPTGRIFKTPYRYLRCSNHGSKKKCPNRSLFPLTNMEGEFFIHFICKTPTHLVSGDDNKELTELNGKMAVKQIKVNNLSKEISNLIKMSRGQEDIEELRIELAFLNKEREAVKTELDNLTLHISRVQDSPNTFTDLKKLFGPTYNPTIKEAKDGIPIFERDETDTVIENIMESLKDNTTREQIRVMLPALLGKITVDTVSRKFFVFNRVGKMVYESSLCHL